ncbi:MAG: phosphoribosylglycinamide formyltransferase [Bryobacteraceae bacterium]|nr:phosphoribosylglycinamide formyltransferase [Bryobacteraceae bacterium]
MKRLGILLSGRGSNFVAIARAVQAGQLPAEIAVVISNRPEAPGLAAARQMGLFAVSLPSKGVAREEYDRQLVELLQQNRVDFVCLAGFLRLLTPLMIHAYPSRILNIHPSLLPAFPGLHAQKQALDYGVRIAGCTVHYVIEEMDAGPILKQAAVPVMPGDTEEDLTQRILAEEHRIYVEALHDLLIQE